MTGTVTLPLIRKDHENVDRADADRPGRLKFSAGDRVYWRYVGGRDRLSRGVVKWATPDIVFLTYPDLPTLPGGVWAFGEIEIYHSGAPDK